MCVVHAWDAWDESDRFEFLLRYEERNRLYLLDEHWHLWTVVYLGRELIERWGLNLGLGLVGCFH